MYIFSLVTFQYRVSLLPEQRLQDEASHTQFGVIGVRRSGHGLNADLKHLIRDIDSSVLFLVILFSHR